MPAFAPDASINAIGLAGPTGRFLQDVVHHMPNLKERFRRIDPAINNARVPIVADRVVATPVGSATVLPPLRGMNAAGDRFSTDGRAVVLALP